MQKLHSRTLGNSSRSWNIRASQLGQPFSHFVTLYNLDLYYRVIYSSVECEYLRVVPSNIVTVSGLSLQSSLHRQDGAW